MKNNNGGMPMSINRRKQFPSKVKTLVSLELLNMGEIATKWLYVQFYWPIIVKILKK